MIDWLAFITLSVVSNTPLPLAFDPIMLEFARTHPSEQAWTAAVVGAIGAGAGGTFEMFAFRVLGRQSPNVGRELFEAPSGPWFYPSIAAMALMPIPFTVVRVAAYLTQARPSLYGLAITAGRLPRHAAIVALSSALTLPSWLGPLMVLLAVSPLLLRWLAPIVSPACSTALPPTAPSR
jgi:uncharacterized membrane protein YdjX (TVP38/TMEM64 family)